MSEHDGEQGFDRRPPLDVLVRKHAGGGGRLEGREVGGGAPATFTMALPTIERPPSATDFFLASTLAGLTSATTPVVYPVAIQIPESNVAVVRSISLLANSLLLTSDLRWRLRFSGSAVPGWNNLTINPRAAGSVELSFTPEETYIPVPENSLIDVEVEVIDGGTYQLSVNLHGWFYNVRLATQAAMAY